MANETRYILTIDSSQAVISLQRAGAAVEQFGRKVEVGESKIRNFASSMTMFRRAVLGVEAILGGFGVGELIKKMIDVNLKFERVRLALLASSDSALAAADNFEWLRTVSIKLGTPIDQVGIQFARFAAATKGTALQGQKTRDIFYEVDAATKVLGLSSTQLSRVMLALTEMVSKMTLQAKEARRQFGQDLPGGFIILAKAAGFTGADGVEKLTQAMKKGQIQGKVFIDMMSNLPKVLHETYGRLFESVAQQSPVIAVQSLQAAFASFLYDLGSKSGFLHEFTFMITQLAAAISDPRNTVGIQHLGEVLAAVMGAVGRSIAFLVQNIQVFAGLFTAFATTTLIIGARGLTLWALSLAGVSKELGLAGALLSAFTKPFFLIALAIGVALGAMVMFNGQLMTFGGVRATMFDWVTGFFQALGTAITDAGKKLNDFIVKIPGIGAGVKTIQKDWSYFWDSLKKLNGDNKNFSNIWGAFRVSFANVIDPIEKAFTPLWQAIRKTAGETWQGIKEDFLHAINAILGVFGTSLKQLPTDLGKIFGGANFQGIVIGARNAFAIIAQVFFGLVRTASIVVRLVIDQFAIMGKAIVPLIGSVLHLFESMLTSGPKAFDSVTGKAATFTSTWKGVVDFLGGFYHLFTDLIAALQFIVTLAAGIFKPLVDAASDAAIGIASAFGNVIIVTSKDLPEASSKGLQYTAGNFAKFADFVIGSLLDVIEVIGKVIKWLGIFAGYFVDIMSKTSTEMGGFAEIMSGAVSFDWKRVNEGADKVKSSIKDMYTVAAATRDKAKNELAADIDYIMNPEKNYHVWSDAEKAMMTSWNSMAGGWADMKASWTRLGENMKDALTNPLKYQEAGRKAGNSYVDQFVDQVVSNTRKITAERAIAAAEQAEMLRKEREAWNLENEQAKKTPTIASPEKGKRGPNDRARDLINQLRSQRELDQALTAQISVDPTTDPLVTRAMEQAQKRFNSIYKDVSFLAAFGNQAGTTALQRQLAQDAVAASLADEKLRQLTDTQKQFQENVAQLHATKQQIDLVGSLGFDPGKIEAYKAAQRQLQQHGYRFTVDEALQGATNEGQIIPKKVTQMVQTSLGAEKLNQELQRTEDLVNAIRDFGPLTEGLALVTAGTVSSDAAALKLNSTLEVQQQLIKEHKALVFDPGWLNDPLTRMWYNQAVAAKIAGGSLTDYIRLLKSQQDELLKYKNPQAFARKQVQDTLNVTLEQLKAYENLAAQTRDTKVGMAQMLQGVGDIGQDEAVSRITKATSDYRTAHDLINSAVSAAVENTNHQLEGLSNDIGDAWKTSFHKFKTEAEDFSGGLQQTFGDAVNGMADALANWVTTGKLSFADLARSVIADIAKMIAKWLVLKAIEAIGFFFAGGGVMTADGPSPLPTKTYAMGGVASSAQHAIFGEGSTPEAYVPLPDGRTIPVTLMAKGGSGAFSGDSLAMVQAITSGVSIGVQQGFSRIGSQNPPQLNGIVNAGPSAVTVHVETHAHIEGGPGRGGQQTPAGVGLDPKTAERFSKQISVEVRNQVIDTVRNEMRPGGAFNPMGSNRSRF